MYHTNSFYSFIKNTNNSCIYIGLGLIFIFLSMLLKFVFNSVISLVIQVLAIMILYYALMSLAKNIKLYVDNHPDFLYNPDNKLIRNNILLSGGLTAILTVLIIYITYTLFF